MYNELLLVILILFIWWGFYCVITVLEDVAKAIREQEDDE